MTEMSGKNLMLKRIKLKIILVHSRFMLSTSVVVPPVTHLKNDRKTQQGLKKTLEIKLKIWRIQTGVMSEKNIAVITVILWHSSPTTISCNSPCSPFRIILKKVG
jgi:hypothetical protein